MKMRTERCKRLFRLILYSISAAVGFGLAPSAKADFLVTVDTSSISGTQGFIDLEFNPGIAPFLAAAATVTNFSTDATFLSSLNGTSATTDGDVTQTWTNTSPINPSTPLIINNTNVLNDLYAPVTYGSTISFDVAFSGPAITSPNSNDNGSSFGFVLYDGNFNPLLTTDLNGTVATINLNPDGSTTTQTFQDSNGNIDASIQPLSAGPAAPAPPAWFLLSIGAIGMWAIQKRLGIAMPCMAA
jgi:hypothetical protein